MASYTTNLNLKKPAGSENVAIGDINGNMDTIDTVVGALRSNLGVAIGGTNNSATISVPNDTSTEINSITLGAGTYILVASVDWQANENGYRQLAFGDGKNPGRNLTSTTHGISGKESYQQVTYLVSPSAQTTYKVYGRQDSGSALNAYPYIIAIRLT